MILRAAVQRREVINHHSCGDIMPVSTVSSTPAAAPVQQTKPAVAADGDSKVRSAHTSQIKDADGDYAAIKPSSSPAVSSANSTLAAITNLKMGG
jgi:hypothetical protein